MCKKIAIGGIGGSGTRVVAQLLNDVGYFIGQDLNDSNDNLLFTLFFKRKDSLVITKSEFIYRYNLFLKICNSGYRYLTNYEKNYLNSLAEADYILHTKEWVKERVCAVVNYNMLDDCKNFAWKEPNTHVVIERILNIDKKVKFIYVYRNGLDMAYSPNQNQLKFWGDIFLNENILKITPKYSLKYWCTVHKRMLSLYKDYPGRVQLINFDRISLKKINELERLYRFIGYNFSIAEVEFLSKQINELSTIGRYKKYDLSELDDEDVIFAKTHYSL